MISPACHRHRLLRWQHLPMMMHLHDHSHGNHTAAKQINKSEQTCNQAEYLCTSERMVFIMHGRVWIALICEEL